MHGGMTQKGGVAAPLLMLLLLLLLLHAASSAATQSRHSSIIHTHLYSHIHSFPHSHSLAHWVLCLCLIPLKLCLKLNLNCCHFMQFFLFNFPSQVAFSRSSLPILNATVNASRSWLKFHLLIEAVSLMGCLPLPAPTLHLSLAHTPPPHPLSPPLSLSFPLSVSPSLSRSLRLASFRFYFHIVSRRKLSHFMCVGILTTVTMTLCVVHVCVGVSVRMSVLFSCHSKDYAGLCIIFAVTDVHLHPVGLQCLTKVMPSRAQIAKPKYRVG